MISETKRSSCFKRIAGSIITLIGAGGFGFRALINPIVPPLAALGAIRGACLTIVENQREEPTQDERNTERYQCTYERLSNIRKLRSDVQQVVARGNSKVLVQYVNAIDEQL